mgnify:CR=1 FL=1
MTLGYNILRRQVKGGTPLNTLRDAAEAQGVAVMAAIEDETRRTFAEHNVILEGQTVIAIKQPAIVLPPQNLPTFNAEKVEEAWMETVREMNHRGFTQEQIEKAKVQADEQSVHYYESPEHTTNISVDEVCIKKQKPHRKRSWDQTCLRFFVLSLRSYCEMDFPNIDCDSSSMASERSKMGFSRFLAGIDPYH